MRPQAPDWELRSRGEQPHANVAPLPTAGNSSWGGTALKRPPQGTGTASPSAPIRAPTATTPFLDSSRLLIRRRYRGRAKRTTNGVVAVTGDAERLPPKQLERPLPAAGNRLPPAGNNRCTETARNERVRERRLRQLLAHSGSLNSPQTPGRLCLLLAVFVGVSRDGQRSWVFARGRHAACLLLVFLLAVGVGC